MALRVHEPNQWILGILLIVIVIIQVLSKDIVMKDLGP